MNQTPASERVHIGIFGKRNAGKSSLINAITNQKLAIVSKIQGTTTDPVYKSMELLPLGPVVLIDTPGLDDEGELGRLRVQKALEVLYKTDLALLVIDASVGKRAEDEDLEKELKTRRIPYLVVYNKGDLISENMVPIKQLACRGVETSLCGAEMYVSTVTGQGIKELKEALAQLKPEEENEKRLAADLLEPLDLVVLVVPIDKAAPKGRLILPQQQTIRDILDVGAVAIAVRDHELEETLKKLGGKPKMVITDSQVFERVASIVPEDVLLTSFSILFVRYKGNLEQMVKGAYKIEKLQDGDKVLICEGCTHHRQCGDIGTEKLPRWITKHTGKKLEFAFASGTEFADNLQEYGLIVHCGGCMLNEKEMQHRLREATEQGIPMTNYGTLIAYMKGILQRSLQPFPSISGMRNQK